MRNLMGKLSNYSQARALKQQLDVNTMTYGIYYHKNAEQLDPTGERASKQEVDALLARWEEIIRLELNHIGVKPSTGVSDASEDIETAQLAVIIQRVCVAGSAALIQGNFTVTQRFLLTCYHVARMVSGKDQRRQKMTLVGKEFKGLLAKDGDVFSVLSKESKEKLKEPPLVVKFMQQKEVAVIFYSQNQSQPEYNTISTPAPAVMHQFQVSNSFAIQSRKMNTRQQQQAQFQQNQVQFAQYQNQPSWFRRGPFKKEYVRTSSNSYRNGVWGPQQSQLPISNFQSSSQFVSCIPVPVAVTTVDHGTVEPDHLSPFSKIRMRKGGKTPNDYDTSKEKSTHHNNENQYLPLREDGSLSGVLVPERLTSKINNWERINGCSFIKIRATPNWLSIEALRKLKQIQTYKKFHGTTIQKLEYQKQLEKKIKKRSNDQNGQGERMRSNILVPKPNGKLRKILYCRMFNNYTGLNKFKMEGSQFIKQIIEKVDHVTTLVLKEAYHQINVSDNLLQYFGFTFKRITYCYRGLPYGFKNSSFIFNKTLRCNAASNVISPGLGKETSNEKMHNLRIYSIHLTWLGVIETEYGGQNAERSKTQNEEEITRMNQRSPQSANSEGKESSISSRIHEFPQIPVRRSFSDPQLSESSVNISNKERGMEQLSQVEQEDPGKSILMALKNQRKQPNKHQQYQLDCIVDNRYYEDRVGSNLIISQMESEGYRTMEGKIALDQQQLTRDGGSPASIEKLSGKSHGGKSVSIDSPNRQLDNRIVSEEMQDNTSANAPSTSKFPNTGNITNPNTDHSQSWTGEQRCRFIESHSMKRGLQHQPADTSTCNESNKLSSGNRSLCDSNEQKASKTLLAVKGSTCNRKKGRIQHQLIKQTTSGSSIDRNNSKSIEETQEGTFNSSNVNASMVRREVRSNFSYSDE
ncbi:MAG: hypothetical protein EZS28_009007 [Streblomastix strix]|uniref:Reverse transcriptase domain-containing protein n=1 Tax=Streblomastix strix TaxID=222440 RepID=A0A5J4WKN1_9EUKA|nr:MAG: hypothetical protein EZS28_009007 [Streblomastix strix]